MTGLLQDGDLAFDLVLMTAALAQSSTLGEAIDNFDSHIVPFVEFLPKLHLAVHASPKLIDNFVLIDNLASGDGVGLHVGNVGLLGGLPVHMVQPRAGVEAIVGLLDLFRTTVVRIKE